jgi:CPA2 family monovalent cation:H+ antiporter-2
VTTQVEFLTSLAVIFGVSALVVFTLGRLKMPSIVGFLVAGVVLGPHGLELVRDIHVVEVFAEIGVILLMFTIGLEFSLKNLVALRAAVLGGGLLQVALTVLATACLSYLLLDQGMQPSIFDGFLVALSSTAIAIKLLLDKGEINAPHGRTSVGILIFQDLCVVPFMLLVPILSGQGGDLKDFTFILLKAGAVVAGVLIAARWGVPHLLHEVVRTRSRELFVITVILMCVGTALLTSELGLSLALGAFLAGIVISESEYAAQAISDILPFKESFTGLFFISIGMLMDLTFLGDNLIVILGVVVVILVLKMATSTVSALILGHSLKTSLRCAFYLSQIGEFSFVLAVAGKTLGLIDEGTYQTFLASSILTMLSTPLFVNFSEPLSGWVGSWKLLKRLERPHHAADRDRYPQRKSGHVIIVGFGINGENLARVLRQSDIPYVILEMNSATVKKMKKRGEPIFYGDGTSIEILHRLRIHFARMLVVAISDAAATRRIVQTARQENPSLHILVRTRYVSEVEDLKSLGANEVIPEEFETSVEVFSRVLHHYHVPKNTIHEYIDHVRQDSYKMLRSVDLPRKHLGERQEFLKGLDTEAYRIGDTSTVSGHSVHHISLRSETGATVIAVQRGDKVHHNPSPDFVLKKGDVILLVGTREQINKAIEYLESDRPLIDRYYR